MVEPGNGGPRYPPRVDSLQLRVQHKLVEERDEPSPVGQVQLERGEASAVLLTPQQIDPEKKYPLITVLHGAGRQDEMLVRGLERFDEAEERQALFLVPRSVAPTWDLIVGGARTDLDFLEYAYDLIYRRYPVDAFRQALVGYSDGASYALSVGLSNPGLFSAVMAWAAGFCVLDPEGKQSAEPAPRLYLEYGTHDELFPFEQIALPMKENLEKAGYDLTFSVDEGGRHWPSGTFQREALDWFFGDREA